MRIVARLLIVSALAAAPAPALAQEAAPVAEVPFDPYSNLVMVQGRIDGSRPLWLILDTGAQRTVVNQRVVDEMGIATGIEGTAVGAAGTQAMKVIPSLTLEIGGDAMRVDTAIAIDLSGLEPAVGRAVDAIVGHEFFLRHVVDIDYAARRVRLYRPETFRYAGRGSEVPLDLAGRAAAVEAEMGLPDGRTLRGRLHLDTGSGSGVSLNAPFVRAHGLADALTGTRRSQAMGVGGASREMQGWLESLVVGGHALARPLVNLSLDTAGVQSQDGRVGMMGGEIFRRFRMTLDYPHGRMFLEPNAALPEPFRANLSGLAIFALGSDFHDFRVMVVHPESPGAAAGLRPGDAILSIDARPAADLTLYEVRELMKVPGAAYTLTISRNGEQQEVRIALPES